MQKCTTKNKGKREKTSIKKNKKKKKNIKKIPPETAVFVFPNI